MYQNGQIGRNHELRYCTPEHLSKVGTRGGKKCVASLRPLRHMGLMAVDFIKISAYARPLKKYLES